MTTPAAETLDRERDKLYLTDAELVRRLGLPDRDGRMALREWSARHPTFPKGDPLLRGRRYWPAVKAWLDARNGLTMGAAEQGRKRHVR